MKTTKSCSLALKALRRMGCKVIHAKGGVRIVPPVAQYKDSNQMTRNQSYTMHLNDKHIGVCMDFIIRNWDHSIYANHIRDLAKASPPLRKKALAKTATLA